MTVEDDIQKDEPLTNLFNEVIPIKGKTSVRKGIKSAGRQARKSALEKVSPGEVEQLFAYWAKELAKKSLLSDQRRAILAWAIHSYGMETCEMAIKGCSMSDWHMGRNPNNVRYDSIELIFRNAEKVEWFVNIFKNPDNDKF